MVLSLAVALDWSRGDEFVYFWTMLMAVVVGTLGFGFHPAGLLNRQCVETPDSLWASRFKRALIALPAKA